MKIARTAAKIGRSMKKCESRMEDGALRRRLSDLVGHRLDLAVDRLHLRARSRPQQPVDDDAVGRVEALANDGQAQLVGERTEADGLGDDLAVGADGRAPLARLGGSDRAARSSA